ncbi:TPA: hypothetical protein ACVUV1_002758 [Staphylococcus aureus]|nr:hypothetical protein [Staphylococcus aureus]
MEHQFLQTMQVGEGPQHREIGTPISADNASWGGAPTQKLTKSQLTIMCRLAGPQHREIGSTISTGNASWGVGPNTENFEKRNSTGNAGWGVGPNTEKLEHQFL